MDEITLARPDDWHAHFRDGAVLADVVPASAARFARAVAMPNLSPPVTTTAAALAYRDRILDAVPRGGSFEPLMTLYLTDRTGADEIRRAAASGRVVGVKLYPAGATTNSAHGVTDLERCASALDAMQECGLALMIHGEVTESDVDVFDRERVFVERTLAPVVDRYPGLKVVLEHVTTAEGVGFVRGAREGVAATITAHHLLLNRNALGRSRGSSTSGVARRRGGRDRAGGSRGPRGGPAPPGAPDEAAREPRAARGAFASGGGNPG